MSQLGQGKATKRTPLTLGKALMLGAVITIVPAAGAEQPVQPAPATPERTATAERIAQLIGELDADKFAVREAASVALAEIGEPAERAIVQALESTGSTEVRRRAGDVLKTIKKARLARNAVRLEDLLDPVKGPQAERFDSADFEARLERLMSVLVDATDNKKLALPIRFQQLNGRLINESQASGVLVTGECPSISFADKSIILADAAVHLSHADSCIIVARYAVEISSSRNCLIIAGHSIQSSTDQGSVLLCGGKIDCTVPRDSVLGGGEIKITSSQRAVTTINCAVPNNPFPRADQDKSRRVDTPGLVLEMKQSPNALADKITVTYCLNVSRPRENGFVLFKRAAGGGEYVARVGQELKAPDGTEIAELKGWRLRYAGRQMAVFSDGKQDSCLAISGR